MGQKWLRQMTWQYLWGVGETWLILHSQRCCMPCLTPSPGWVDQHMPRASEPFTAPPPILRITTPDTHHEIRVSVPVVSLSLNLHGHVMSHDCFPHLHKEDTVSPRAWHVGTAGSGPWAHQTTAVISITRAGRDPCRPSALLNSLSLIQHRAPQNSCSWAPAPLPAKHTGILSVNHTCLHAHRFYS